MDRTKYFRTKYFLTSIRLADTENSIKE